ncbi:hypothetical protein CPHO_03250 [Corynebacterium phocae]|uniref:Gram-positive pilin subunit D1 N-terminal domain-containing protein n=1 Tax=Corynebacterium phocae TaxID=161895 RepID=A0A1L7D1V6_9CORY|nr:SpaH/EbpB family LPXTG-anchored major pilin [Corynebacterium phocae]APT92070.1 hypothetical protein CPHO_03250 [Corynebacterium phocae]KAA8726455.1 isopeptide-forming domain-containing fimbrial protein [Corynebacterium phocae]
MNNFSRKMISLCAATTIACAGAGIGLPVAFGQDTFPRTLAPTDLQDQTKFLDNDHEVTIKVSKYVGEAGDQTSPLAGVAFEVQQVQAASGQGFDFTTQEAWEELNQLVDGDVDQKIADIITGKKFVGTAKTDETGADGSATFTFNPATDDVTYGPGVYLVTEKLDAQDVEQYNLSETSPFLVVVPSLDDAGNWVYSQEAFPKNQEIKATKEVDDNDLTLGKDVKYRLQVKIPSTNLDTLKVTDELVPQLQYKEDLEVELVSESSTTPPVPLTKDTDYTLSAPQANNPGGTVEVEFTDEGRKKVEEFYSGNTKLSPATPAHHDGIIRVDFSATLVELPDKGILTNTAKFDINGKIHSTDDDKGTPDKSDDTPASTTLANLELTKTGSDTASELEGAEFELYRCIQEQASNEWKLLGDKLSVGNSSADPTNVDKLITEIDATTNKAMFKGYGLPVSSHSTSVLSTKNNDFCVIETKSPAGFVRNPEIHHLTLEQPADQAPILKASIDNQKTTFLNQLPATGAWGIILVFLVGLGLLARGLYTTRRDNLATA